MVFPICNRVVVVDNVYNEAKPLLQTLNKKGIPYFYYDGENQGLPSNPLSGIRLLFLDIELEGTSGSSERNKISKLMGVYNKIIAKDNGPLCIIFWTSHSEVTNTFLAEMPDNYCKPTISLCIEKQTCMTDNEFDLPKLRRKLQKVSEELKSFHLYLGWENAVTVATGKYITSFNSFVPNDKYWSKNVSNLFFLLHKANFLKTKDKKSQILFREACTVFNQAFLSTLVSYTNRIKIPVRYCFSSSGIPAHQCEAIAKLNTLLFVNETKKDSEQAGLLFYCKSNKITSCLKNHLIISSDKKKSPDYSKLDVLLCKVVLTPACDIAQDNLLKTVDGNSVHRFIYGIRFKGNLNSLKLLQLQYYKSESSFLIENVWIKGAIYSFIFHVASIQSETLPSARLGVSLNKELLFDLQTKVAMHANRLGNSLLS